MKEYIPLENGDYKRTGQNGETVYYRQVPCSFCNKKLFRRKADKVKNSFCDHKCKKNYKIKNNDYKTYEIGKEYPVSEGRVRVYTSKSWSYRIKRKCENCSEEIYRENGMRSGKYHFCLKDCEDIFHRPKDFRILENMDDKNFYYMIGLIATDGCVIYPDDNNLQQSYAMNMVLQENDKYLLQSLRDRYGGVYFISEQNDSFNPGKIQQKHNWAMYTKKFVLYLQSIGITRRKSLTLDMNEFFNSLSYDFKRSFMRGVIDGDGSVCIDKNNQLIVSFSSGSKIFCRMVLDYLQDIVQSNKSLHTNKMGQNYNYNMSFTHKQSIQICEHLYSDLDEEMICI